MSTVIFGLGTRNETIRHESLLMNGVKLKHTDRKSVV